MRINIVHVLVLAALVVAAVLIWKHRARVVAAFKG